MRKDIQDKFHQIISKQISLREFEQWVYQTSELESLLPSEDYLTLVSFDYKHADGFYEIEKVLGKYVALHEYESTQLSNLLLSIINKDSNAKTSIQETYYLYCKGYKFFDDIGLNYGLDIVVPETQTFEDMYPKVIDVAKQALALLESKQIVFTNEINNEGIFKYQDLRKDT